MSRYPIRPFRTATKQDVVDLLAASGQALQEDKLPFGARALYTMRGAKRIDLDCVEAGQRPDWRGMLVQLGSDWA